MNSDGVQWLIAGGDVHLLIFHFSDQDTRNRVKTVWICGDNLVALASRTAKLRTCGIKQPGQPGTEVRLYWRGEHTMTWHNLVPRLQQFRWELPHPDVLIIHLQVKEISIRDTEELARSIKNSLILIGRIFPQCLIVWSDILNESISRQDTVGDVTKAGDKFHDMINGRMHAVVAKLGGTSVSHDNIGPELYRRNGKRLTCQGMYIFKTNIQNFVDKWAKDVPHISKCPWVNAIKVRMAAFSFLLRLYRAVIKNYLHSQSSY